MPTDKGANAGLKVASLVAGMVAGADSIDDMALLQASSSTEEPRSELVEYIEAAWPQPDLKVIDDSNRDQLAKASELVDFNKADYAGAYVDERTTPPSIPTRPSCSNHPTTSRY